MIENTVTYIAIAEGTSFVASEKMLATEDNNICIPA